MKITIEPTTKIVDIGGGLQARVWEGQTEGGTAVHLFVTRVAVSKDEPAHVLERFEQELTEQKEPSVAWPTRFIL